MQLLEALCLLLIEALDAAPRPADASKCTETCTACKQQSSYCASVVAIAKRAAFHSHPLVLAFCAALCSPRWRIWACFGASSAKWHAPVRSCRVCSPRLESQPLAVLHCAGQLGGLCASCFLGIPREHAQAQAQSIKWYRKHSLDAGADPPPRVYIVEVPQGELAAAVIGSVQARSDCAQGRLSACSPSSLVGPTMPHPHLPLSDPPRCFCFVSCWHARLASRVPSASGST